MKIVAGILGLISGLIGIIGGFGTVAFGALGKAVEAEGAKEVMEAGAGAFWFSFLIVFISSLIFKWSKWNGILLIILGIVCTTLGNIISGPIASIAGIIAFIAGFVGNKTNTTTV